jgi:hypothetical protein
MARIKKSGHWQGFGEDEMIDTDDLPKPATGPMVLFRLDPSHGAERHIRLYAPRRYFKFSHDNDAFWKENHLVFDSLVESRWGILALLCMGAWVPKLEQDRERSLLFFQGLVDNWDAYQAERDLFYDEYWTYLAGPYFWNNASSWLWTHLVQAGGVPQTLVQGVEMKAIGDEQARDWVLEYVLKPNDLG